MSFAGNQIVKWMDYIKSQNYSTESIKKVANSVGGHRTSTIYRWIKAESEYGSYLPTKFRAAIDCIVPQEVLDFISLQIMKNSHI